MRPDFGPGSRLDCPGKEFDAVGADAGVALAEAAREVGAIVICGGFFGDDQEIVAAGMGLGEGNQSSSGCMDSWRGLRRTAEQSCGVGNITVVA